MRDGECKSESDKDNYSWLYFQFEQNVNIDIRNVRYRDILNVYIYIRYWHLTEFFFLIVHP